MTSYCPECPADPLMDRHEHIGSSPLLTLLNLSFQLVPEWKLEVKASENVDLGYTSIDREERAATIHYDPALEGAALERVLKHELVHVLLADMDFIACNGRSIEIMEIFNLFEERVCNALARVL